MRGYFCFFTVSLFAVFLLMLVELLNPEEIGTMQPLSQNSKPSLNPQEESLMNNDNLLNQWTTLSTTFNQGLQEHEKQLMQVQLDLQTASNKLQISEAYGAILKNSLNSLLQKNRSLQTSYENASTLADQVGERLQEADEWNAQLQEENYKLQVGCLHAIIAIIIMVLVILVLVYIHLRKFIKPFIPWLP